MATEKDNWLSKVNPNIVIWAAGIWLGYKYVVTPLLESLNLKDTAEEKETKIINATAPITAGNPWSPVFYKTCPIGTKLLVPSDAQAKAKSIKAYEGFFSDDYNRVLGVFQTLGSKAQVSYLCDVFQQMYGVSLYGFLQAGRTDYPWFGGGLTAEHLGKINALVNSYPNYYK